MLSISNTKIQFNGLQEISVYYTDENHVLHDLVYNSTARVWNEGTISEENYVTFPNSSITAMYNQCLLCANTTFVVYQDINGFVQMANLTSSGWILTQLDLNATLGTGLAIQPFYHTGEADQINLYYQTSTLLITLASWHPVLSSTKSEHNVLCWVIVTDVCRARLERRRSDLHCWSFRHAPCSSFSIHKRIIRL